MLNKRACFLFFAVAVSLALLACSSNSSAQSTTNVTTGDGETKVSTSISTEAAVKIRAYKLDATNPDLCTDWHSTTSFSITNFEIKDATYQFGGKGNSHVYLGSNDRIEVVSTTTKYYFKNEPTHDNNVFYCEIQLSNDTPQSNNVP